MEPAMKRALSLGVTIAMTACTNHPAADAQKVPVDPRRIQPSPVQIPAEIDPPPPVQPGFEGPGLTPAPPPQPKNR
jgi:hypothetical protein